MIKYRGTGKPLTGIGKRIDDACYKKDINYKKLGQLTGLSKQSIYRIIDNYDCKLSNMAKIADVLGVSIDWLVYGKQK